MEYGKCSMFHTSNIYRRTIFPYTKLNAPPEGRSFTGHGFDEWCAEGNAFSARQRYSRPQRLFFAYFFLTSQKKVCRRRHPAPTAHPKCAAGGCTPPCGAKNGCRRHPAPADAKNRKGESPFRFFSFQKAHENNGRCRLRSRRRSDCGNRPWPAAHPLRHWSYSRFPRS